MAQISLAQVSTVAGRVEDAVSDQQADSPLERVGAWLEGFPDTRARRALHRAPVALWRLGLGRLVGRPLVLVTARGRSSGQPRRTALMAHRLGGRLYLWCPYGERAQWYRNVCAHPLVTLQAADGVHAARAVGIETAAEAAAVYRMLKDFDADMLRRYLEGIGIADTPSGVVADWQRLHIFRFDPVSDVPLPPQRADLLWVWPVAAGVIGLAAWALVRRKHISSPCTFPFTLWRAAMGA